MPSAAAIKQRLGELDKEAYIDLLRKLISETTYLQNDPGNNLIPKEDKAVKHIRDVLDPLSKDKGGPLLIEQINYVEGRGNLIVTYPGTEPNKVVSFVGMHMDVVPADCKTWDFCPFKLTIEGDQLRGRGTTDCLGHVALVTELMRKLAEQKPKLRSTVVAVFIACEENASIPGVGVEELYKNGKLDNLKPGPLYWVDCADSQPCIGTAGVIPWHFDVTGRLFHSGLPNKAINALELGSEAIRQIQDEFYQEFPPRQEEKEYFFENPSTMKPTQWSYPSGAINQIPGKCNISGDVRLTPFYKVQDVTDFLDQRVRYWNENIEKLPTRGTVSKYVLKDEGIRGKLEISYDDTYSGIAIDYKDSIGYKVLANATQEVIGYVQPYSLTGSLPLVGDLQPAGYDVQACGYGLTAVYHAENEYCLYSDMANGFKIFASVISQLEEV